MLALALAAAAAGCAEKPTQLVVVVSTDMTAPDELDQVRVRTFAGSDATPIDDQTLPVPAGGGPSAVAFRSVHAFDFDPPGGQASRPVRVAVDAMNAGRTLFTTEVRTGFASGKRLRLDVYVVRRCLAQAATCLPDETCGVPGCVAPDVSVNALPEQGNDTPPTGIDPRGRTLNDAGR